MSIESRKSIKKTLWASEKTIHTKKRIITHFRKNIWLFTKKVVILRSILNFNPIIFKK